MESQLFGPHQLRGAKKKLFGLQNRKCVCFKNIYIYIYITVTLDYTTVQRPHVQNTDRNHMCFASFVWWQDMPLAWLTSHLCLCSGWSVQTEPKVRQSAGKAVIRGQTAKLPQPWHISVIQLPHWLLNKPIFWALLIKASINICKIN